MSEKQFYDSIHGTTEVLIPFEDGTEHVGDPGILYRVSDIFLSEYGMGGCRSLEEFTTMISETDPVILDGLLMCINTRKLSQSYDDKGKPMQVDRVDAEKFVRDEKRTLENEEAYPEENYVPVPIKKLTNPEIIRSNRNQMSNFLFDMGADKKELELAKEKLKEGKIDNLNDYDYLNDSTKSGLKVLEVMDDDTFRDTLRQMNEDNKKSVNFKVSIETMQKRASKNG